MTDSYSATTTAPVLEKKRKDGFWFRKWDSLDVTHAFWLLLSHLLAACAPFVFDWGALLLGTFLSFFLTGICVTLGYHRLLAHRSFKVPKWLEYSIVYLAALSFQKDPIFWVSIHRYHHQYVDTERDPHSPSCQGFWFSHLGWLLYNDNIATKCGESKSGEYSNVEDLKKEPFYMFLHKTYSWHVAALTTLLYIYGGFPYLAWGLGYRGVVELHSTFLVNSAAHIWGNRPWNTSDTSTNNWLVAMLTFGEGWHNNHHAFPRSARHGLEWWQFDLTWQVIKFLQAIGLATDVKLPSEAEKTKMAAMPLTSKLAKKYT